MARGKSAGNAGQGSNWIRRSTRLRIYARDGWRCVCCRQALYALRGAEPIGPHACLPSRELATLDHLVPRERGGSNHASNLVAACAACNERRGTRSAIEFAFAGELSREPHVVCDDVILAIARELPPRHAAERLAVTPEECAERRRAAQRAA